MYRVALAIVKSLRGMPARGCLAAPTLGAAHTHTDNRDAHTDNHSAHTERLAQSRNTVMRTAKTTTTVYALHTTKQCTARSAHHTHVQLVNALHKHDADSTMHAVANRT